MIKIKKYMEEKTLSLALPINLSAATSTLVFVILSILSFATPFLLGQPQWLIGTIVNASLFLATIFLPKKYFLPLVVFPSLGVLARGIIFGPFTFFLVYFLPFIWLANLILILIFKKLFLYIKYLPSVFLSVTAKCLFLFAVANVYFGFHIVPKLFLQTMGIAQLLTGLAGGIISFIIFKSYGEYNTRS